MRAGCSHQCWCLPHCGDLSKTRGVGQRGHNGDKNSVYLICGPRKLPSKWELRLSGKGSQSNVPHLVVPAVGHMANLLPSCPPGVEWAFIPHLPLSLIEGWAHIWWCHVHRGEVLGHPACARRKGALTASAMGGWGVRLK